MFENVKCLLQWHEKSIFTVEEGESRNSAVAEGESRNSAVAEGEKLVSNKNSVKW